MQYQNFPETVSNLISTLVNNLLSSIDSNIFSVLDELAFLKSSSISDKYFLSFFARQSGVVSLAEALILGVLIYYAISYLFSVITCSNYQKPIYFITKLIVTAILIRFSLSICEKIIDIFYLISTIVKTIGNVIFSTELSFSVIYTKLKDLFFSDLSIPFSFFSFDGILRTFISVGFVNLLFTYSIRFIYVKILVLVSPLAFLSLSLDQSSWIFKIWLKNFISQLFTQVIICLVLLIIFSLKSTSNPVIVKLLYVASVVCLMKASSFVKDFSSGFTSDVSSSLSSIKGLFS